LLVRLVDRDEKNRAAALAALVKTPLLAIESLDPRSWRSLRTRLESKHADVRRLAAAIVARGHDVGAFHDLVDLMEDDDSMVRRGASQALRRMTGLGATTDVGRWRSWYAGEQEWRADRIDDDLQLLESADPCVVAATLRSLTQHRLLRDAFLADIHHVLDHEDAAVREIACRTLAALGSPGSAPDLVPLLEDPVERVRSAAHAALLGVTGLRHGPDRGLWRSALRPR
jgi:HEAT repeat protein